MNCFVVRLAKTEFDWNMSQNVSGFWP